MKLHIPKIIQELPLSDHAPEYDSAVIQVWVNPPRGKMAEFEEIRADLLGEYGELAKAVELEEGEDKTARLKEIGDQLTSANQRLYEWWAVIWSQGDDENNHWTTEEIKTLQENCLEGDPELWVFVTQRAFEMILEYRGERKKKLNRRY